ncbi:MAG TPA: hypothetical protein VEL03_12480 [Streptosporangiaceae bacterium]|nr:hypothetical protein [Streptosporangiaceae bacterium]
MRVAYWLVAAILAWTSWYAIRVSVRAWRGEGVPWSQRRSTALMDPDLRAGMDRGGLAFGLAWGFMAVFLAGFALALSLHARGRIVGGVLSAAAVAMIVFIGFGCSIVEFNRPKFLVPPRHRDEPGAFTARRRLRRSLLK